MALVGVGKKKEAQESSTEEKKVKHFRLEFGKLNTSDKAPISRKLSGFSRLSTYSRQDSPHSPHSPYFKTPSLSSSSPSSSSLANSSSGCQISFVAPDFAEIDETINEYDFQPSLDSDIWDFQKCKEYLSKINSNETITNESIFKQALLSVERLMAVGSGFELSGIQITIYSLLKKTKVDASLLGFIENTLSLKSKNFIFEILMCFYGEKYIEVSLEERERNRAIEEHGRQIDSVFCKHPALRKKGKGKEIKEEGKEIKEDRTLKNRLMDICNMSSESEILSKKACPKKLQHAIFALFVQYKPIDILRQLAEMYDDLSTLGIVRSNYVVKFILHLDSRDRLFYFDDFKNILGRVVDENKSYLGALEGEKLNVALYGILKEKNIRYSNVVLHNVNLIRQWVQSPVFLNSCRAQFPEQVTTVIEHFIDVIASPGTEAKTRRNMLKELAKEFQEASLYYYHQIHPLDFFDPEIKKDQFSFYFREGETFNRIKDYVVNKILSEKSHQERAYTIAAFVDLAKLLSDTGELRSSMAINTAFSDVSIDRIKLAFKLLSEETKSTLGKLNKLFSHKSNFKALRNASDKASMPLTFLLKKDIVIFEGANPEEAGDVVLKFYNSQKKLFHQDFPFPDLPLSLLLSLDNTPRDEDYFYLKSESIYPHAITIDGINDIEGVNKVLEDGIEILEWTADLFVKKGEILALQSLISKGESLRVPDEEIISWHKDIDRLSDDLKVLESAIKEFEKSHEKNTIEKNIFFIIRIKHEKIIYENPESLSKLKEITFSYSEEAKVKKSNICLLKDQVKALESKKEEFLLGLKKKNGKKKENEDFLNYLNPQIIDAKSQLKKTKSQLSSLQRALEVSNTCYKLCSRAIRAMNYIKQNQSAETKVITAAREGGQNSRLSKNLSNKCLKLPSLSSLPLESQPLELRKTRISRTTTMIPKYEDTSPAMSPMVPLFLMTVEKSGRGSDERSSEKSTITRTKPK